MASRSLSRLAPFAVALALVLLLGAAGPALGSSPGYGHPFAISKPITRDLIAAQLAFSSDGSVAAAFGSFNEDSPWESTGLLSISTPGNPFGPVHTVPGTQQVLALGYRGSSLDVVTGTGGGINPCCGKAQAFFAGPHGFGPHRTLISGLTSGALGSAVPLGTRLLAVVGTSRGLWASQAGAAGHFGGTRRLSAITSSPQAFDATSLVGQRSIVAWTAETSLFTPARSIFTATGSAGALPGGLHAALTVPDGNTIDEVAVAPNGSIPTVAWIQSYYDSAGVYHSRAFAEDLVSGHRTVQALSPSTEVVSGLALAGAGDGSEVVAFDSCSSAGTCDVRAALRRPHQRFGAGGTLGGIDPSQTPTVAESPFGDAIVGWVDRGDVISATASRGASRLGGAHTVSAAGDDSDLTVGFAPDGTRALEAWTQGTVAENLEAAYYATGEKPPAPPKKKK